MPRKQKTIHYLYKTTCLITGRYYIGMHSTANLEDGYMGSGKRLRYSLRKYGKENHIKEILEFFDSRELLVEAERNVITSDMLTDIMCMNLMSGGTGGFISAEIQLKRSHAGNKIHNEKLKTDEEYYRKFVEKISIGLKKAHKEGKLKGRNGGPNKGKSLSENHKEKIGLANSIKQKGKKNSQFGVKFKWINNGIKNAKLKNEKMPDGWRLGKLPIKK